MTRFVTAAAAGILVLISVVSADAQMFSYGGLERRATQALSLTTYKIDFVYDGSGEPMHRLDWDGWAYGLSFDRRNFFARIVFGNAGTDFESVSGKLHMVDVALSGWGELVRTRGSSASVGLPIVIHSGFRSVDGNFVNTVDEAFSYTVLGIGTGVSFEAEPAHSVNVQAHAWPVIAMAFRSFEGFAGTSTMVDADLQVHFMNLFGRYGLSAGYGYRWQKWNTDDSGLVGNVDPALFDYKSNQHMLRLGLNW
jgi:hypothetical protein